MNNETAHQNNSVGKDIINIMKLREFRKENTFKTVRLVGYLGLTLNVNNDT